MRTLTLFAAPHGASDLRSADLTLIGFWLGLPSAVRYLIVIVTILGAGWTARGTFSEWVGIGARVQRLEVEVADLRATTANSTRRIEAIQLYLLCRGAEIDAGRSPAPCTHYVRGYPDIFSMLSQR